MRNFIYTAILLCLTSIILGAFGAHLLKEILTEFQLSSFETGVRFQMFHGLVILILSFNKKYFNDKLKFALKIMTLGTVIFSLSIYLLNLQEYLSINLSLLGPITPIGGLLIIISWLILLFIVKRMETYN